MNKNVEGIVADAMIKYMKDNKDEIDLYDHFLSVATQAHLLGYEDGQREIKRTMKHQLRTANRNLRYAERKVFFLRKILAEARLAFISNRSKHASLHDVI